MSDAAALMDRMYRHQRHIYDLSRKYYLIGRDEAIARLDARPGDCVLEIGCGTGRNLIRAARAYPEARFCGLDVSREMLDTAEAAIRRAGLAGRIAVAQADATAFDPNPLFGRDAFDRVMISYALSMIPPWREALARALDVVAPGGALHVVDFGDCAGLPGPFKTTLRRWLAAFDVTPRDDLGEALAALADARGLSAATQDWRRGYATLAVARRAA
ncbi:class I SAM-dependent methyltransferase [Roseiarcus sp.]|uniref:class I SAM-dependent methyltransferase n=1 Tax=Roseiarcus sp. TaxID=1969460 RepID=UPI003F9AC581